MDLANLTYDNRTIDILHPGTGEKLGITVELMSVNDPRMNSFKARVQADRMARERMRKQETVEDVNNISMDLICKTVMGWKGVELNGKKLEYSVENMKMIFDTYPWFKAQVEEAITDDKGFFPG